MRPIHIVLLDKPRPALVLTREAAWNSLPHISVAPITSTIKDLVTEVRVGPENGLDEDSVVSLDNVDSVTPDRVGKLIGYLNTDQEAALAKAIKMAFDLETRDGMGM